MDTPTKPSLKTTLFGDERRELKVTRRLLERLPDEHLTWKPHEKSMTLGELATHVVNLLYWQLMTLRQDAYDLAAGPSYRSPLESRDALLALFDENVARVQEAFEQTEDPAFGKPWTLKHGDHDVFTMPRGAVYRMGISHIVHHRGQLSVYLRLLDVPLPPIYGPTADESSM